MTDKEDWVCGDCGTKYPYTVQYCKNRKLDRKMLDKWQDGYLTGKEESRKVLVNEAKELADAIRVISNYGFVAVHVSKLDTK